MTGTTDTTTRPLLSGRYVHEPADELDPEAGYLIWESDKGPMGIDVRIWRETSDALDVWAYLDWDEWHVESISEANDMAAQATRLAQWLKELAAMLHRFGGMPK